MNASPAALLRHYRTARTVRNMSGMTIIDCAALVRAGLWSADRCCGPCHAMACEDDFILDLGPDARLELCCRSGCEATLDSEAFRRVLGATPAFAAQRT